LAGGEAGGVLSEALEKARIGKVRVGGMAARDSFAILEEEDFSRNYGSGICQYAQL
jgi:hypothetical protein